MEFPIELSTGKLLSYEKKDDKAGRLKLEYKFSCLKENEKIYSCDEELYAEFKKWFDSSLSEIKKTPIKKGDIIENVLLNDYRMARIYFYDGETIIPPYNITATGEFVEAPYQYGYLPLVFAGLTNKPLQYWFDVTHLKAMNLNIYKDKILENMKKDEKGYVASSWFVASNGVTYGILTNDYFLVDEVIAKVSEMTYYALGGFDNEEETLTAFVNLDISLENVFRII